jgi:hypothetical protein
MAGIYQTPESARFQETYPRPEWAGQVLNHDSLVHGGAWLDKTAFAPGVKLVLAGTLVQRTNSGFGPVLLPPSPTLDDVFIVAFDVADLQNNPKVQLFRPYSSVYDRRLWWYFAGSTVPKHLASAETNPLGLGMTVKMRDHMLNLLYNRYYCTPGKDVWGG